MADLSFSRQPVYLADSSNNPVAVLNAAPSTEYGLVVRPIPSGTQNVSITGTNAVDTELPTAAALADNAATPTAPAVGAFGMAFDGTTWDRMRGDSANGLLVNLGTNNDVTVTGTVTANAGTGPFPVSDNAGSLTIDSPGIPTALGQTTMASSMPVAIASNQSSIPVTGTFWQATQPVSIAATVTVDSELPTAAALADAAANPTTPTVGSALLIYSGTSWDRARSANVAGTLKVGGATASDAAIAAYPITVGGRASTAVPTAVSADGDVVDAWYSRSGALNVTLRDTSGNYVSSGGGTEYTEDTALGAVGSALGTLGIARASAAAPTSVSADGDAVGLWAARFGALNVILRDTAGSYVSVGGGTQYSEDAASTGGETMTLAGVVRQDTLASSTSTDGDYAYMKVDSVGRLWVGADLKSVGGTAVSLGQKAMTASIPVVIASDQSAISVDTELPAAASLADATSNPTVPGVGAFAMGYNGTTWDRIRTANTGRLQVDVVTGGSAVSPDGVPSGYNGLLLYGSTTATASGGTASVVTNTPANTKAFYVKSVLVAASGATKWQVKFGGTVLATGFAAQAGLAQAVTFDPPLAGTGDGATALTIDVTNREDSAMDLYANLNGYVQA